MSGELGGKQFGLLRELLRGGPRSCAGVATMKAKTFLSNTVEQMAM